MIPTSPYNVGPAIQRDQGGGGYTLSVGKVHSPDGQLPNLPLCGWTELICDTEGDLQDLCFMSTNSFIHLSTVRTHSTGLHAAAFLA